MTLGTGCLLHQHPTPVPVEAVPLWPPARGGALNGARIFVCANSAGLIWDLLWRIEDHAQGRAHDTARAVLAHAPCRWRQAFPGPERVVAYRMWLQYGDAFLRGALEDMVTAWWPSGLARHRDFPSVDDLMVAADWPLRLRRRLTEL